MRQPESLLCYTYYMHVHEYSLLFTGLVCHQTRALGASTYLTCTCKDLTISYNGLSILYSSKWLVMRVSSVTLLVGVLETSTDCRRF